MSETIGEMILPGTYIDVRAEGLIGVGGIPTGNIGVVGTANRGPIGSVQVLGSYTEALDTFGAYDAWPAAASDQANALTLTRTLEQLFAGGASTVYAVRVAKSGGTDPASAKWAITDDGGATLFTITATSPGTWANKITVAIDAPVGGPYTLTLTYGRAKETYTAGSAGEMAQEVIDGSRLVTVTGPADADKAKAPTKVATTAPQTVTGGPDGFGATSTEIATGLALLSNQPINIVVIGGLSAKDGAAAALTHLEQTENDGRERIAVMGVSTDTPADLISNDSSKGSSPRLVLVAPGLVAADAASTATNKNVKLSASYAAALVAGKLSTLAPQVSLTNKDVPAFDLTTEYSRAQQKQLLNNQVLVLQKNLGIRVLKGISTDTGAFRQISVRRIVDYAKAGVRIGSNPYIGRLNNDRVRAALKATLDGFLAGMVLDEMLVAYKLDVTATRAQEIVGQAIVQMTLQPTFSIDFVKVIMNLQ
jgi:hypothetical protein